VCLFYGGELKSRYLLMIIHLFIRSRLWSTLRTSKIVRTGNKNYYSIVCMLLNAFYPARVSNNIIIFVVVMIIMTAIIIVKMS